jgi:hypothetical protein
MIMFKKKSQNISIFGRTSPLGMLQTIPLPTGVLRRREFLYFFTGDSQQIRRHDGAVNITLERPEALPCATRETETPFEPGDARFYSGSEIAKFSVNILASTHIGNLEPAFFGETYILDFSGFGDFQVAFGGEPAIQSDLQRAATVNFVLTIDHGFHQS